MKIAQHRHRNHGVELFVDLSYALFFVILFLAAVIGTVEIISTVIEF